MQQSLQDNKDWDCLQNVKNDTCQALWCRSVLAANCCTVMWLVLCVNIRYGYTASTSHVGDLVCKTLVVKESKH